MAIAGHPSLYTGLKDGVYINLGSELLAVLSVQGDMRERALIQIAQAAAPRVY